MAAPHPGDDPMTELLAAAQALARARGADAAWTCLLDAARRLTGASHVALWQRDPGSGELSMLAPRREPRPRLQPGRGLAGHCAQTGRPQTIRDAREHADIDLDLLAGTDRERGGVALCLPLASGDGIQGVLELLDTRGDGFNAAQAHCAEWLAACASLAMQRASCDAGLALLTEVEVAREIQHGTLPTTMPDVPGYDLCGHFQPATYAGGDMLDVVRLPQGLFLLLGDATGHGFGPALSATGMQGMLRVAFRIGAGLDDAYRHVNNQLAEDLADDRFITAFMGLLDPASHRVRYHCAGQGPLLHFHAADARCEWLQPTTFPVGVMELAATPAGAELQLAPGDILALISDGLYERLDAGNTEFGPGRVADVVRTGCNMPMAELCRRLLAAADDFAGGVAAVDDVTLILVRRLPRAEDR